VVLNIYNTVHTYNTKKSGTITGKAAILEPQIQTNIWLRLWTQPKNVARTTSLCSHVFLVLRDHGVCMCIVCIWEWSSAHALGGGRRWCGIIHYYWWTASIEPGLLFSRAGYASWGLSLSSVKYYLLQLVFSACVAAVKSRPVLHHCVVMFFWSSGTMECACVLFAFENGVLLMRWGRRWCGIIHYYWWTVSIEPGLLFSLAGYASWGLSLSSV